MPRVLLLIPFFCLAACEFEQDADINPPIVAPKLVVVAFISPQSDTLAVSVTLSQPVFSTYQSPNNPNGYVPPVSDATVRLSDGNREVTLPYQADAQQYEIEASALPILPGKTYTLWVSTPDGKSVRANCTVPAKTNTTIDFQLRYEVDPTGLGTQERTYKIDLNWQDLPGTGDFYQVGANTRVESTYEGTADSEVFFVGLIFSSSTVFSDEGQDGGKFTLTNGDIGRVSTRREKKIVTEVQCVLRTVDEPYYRYYQYLDKIGNELFSEPIAPYTNIEGGLGVFAAYNQYTKVVPVE